MEVTRLLKCFIKENTYKSLASVCLPVLARRGGAATLVDVVLTAATMAGTQAGYLFSGLSATGQTKPQLPPPPLTITTPATTPLYTFYTRLTIKLHALPYDMTIDHTTHHTTASACQLSPLPYQPLFI